MIRFFLALYRAKRRHPEWEWGKIIANACHFHRWKHYRAEGLTTYDPFHMPDEDLILALRELEEWSV